MAKANPAKRLLVEGEEDKRVIVQLMKASGVAWGDTRDTSPVEIRPYGGFESMVKQSAIGVELKASA